MKYSSLLLVFILLSGTNKLEAQLLSTKGKDFWAGFMYINIPPLTHLHVYITAERPCMGIVENRSGSFRQNFSVRPSTAAVIELPVPLFYTYESESVFPYALHVNASDSVSVVISTQADNGFLETTTVFPIASLGSDYFILTYNLKMTSVSQHSSQFILVGVEDNTIVQIRPSVLSSLGTAALPFTITLNKGQTYLYKSKEALDLTGSEIHVLNDCKKVAVFSGNECSFIPDCPACNNYFEQNVPLNTLGTQYLVTPSLTRSRDYFRIVATQDNTSIFIDNILIGIFNKGKIYEQYIEKPIVVRSSRPAMVSFMGMGFKCSEGETLPAPFMVHVTSMEQAVKSATFTTIDDQSPRELVNCVNIHVRTAYTAQTFLDGKNIGNLFTVFPGNPIYSYARIELEKGVHTLANTNGFTAYQYGFGKKSLAGYGMSVGSSLNKSSQFSMVNGISSNLQKDFYFCPLQALKFEAIRQDTLYSKVYWFFSDGTKDSGNVVNKSFVEAGCYTVQMISYYTGSSGNCLLGDKATDTTTMNVCVQPDVPLSLGPDIYSCADSIVQLQPKGAVPSGFIYQWSDSSFTESITVNKAGTYSLQVQNGECKATDTINVLVQGTPLLNGGTDKFLCIGDSVLVSNSINEPDVEYSWSNGTKGYRQYIKEPGVYTLTATRHDCVATTSVNVKLLTCPGIYVPGAFTPNDDGKNDIIRPVMGGLNLDYFRIYNRWGQLVFQTSTSMAGWNGVFNNEKQTTGVYVYVVSAVDATGKRTTKKGTFVLLR
ncbi:MAG: gliding motility-associated C-terminal domain-containing protein [Bacteroidetes bacterium]|nr:gliding motility-associated C-terminal domain-containing protein [Bacteroidota bacterium]MBS1610812.1 gliding motility-associated C-terminal domain-containing protein [Bacteroidota bacterium]